MNELQQNPPTLLCVGESMMLLTPDVGGLHGATHLGLHVGGAEGNVAAGLAHLGHDVEWFSRVGADPFGARITDFLAERGVNVNRVESSASHPTGVYFKDRVDGRNTVHYYRAGSAASTLGPDDIDRLRLGGRSLVHFSGITAAISASADELVERLLTDLDNPDFMVSFDVNYRAALWPVSQAAPRLREVASRADIVLVGRDEAEELWGTVEPDEIRALLPEPTYLIVKDAHVGATCFHGDAPVFVPSSEVDVVDPVGAGDAFAAGFLAGLTGGFEVARSLRLGHLMAAHTLGHVSDLPVLPPAEEILAASQAPDEEGNR